MEDIIQKYKKEKKIRNLSIIVTSLALALGLNIVLSNTDGGKYLTANVINNQTISQNKSDIFLENNKNSGNVLISLKSSKEISKVKSISFSLVYNNENVKINNKKITIDSGDILNIVDNNGYNTISINFKNPINVKSGENIMDIVLEKKIANKENLNLINANVIDSDNNSFMLSTSGVEF